MNAERMALDRDVDLVHRIVADGLKKWNRENIGAYSAGVVLGAVRRVLGLAAVIVPATLFGMNIGSAVLLGLRIGLMIELVAMMIVFCVRDLKKIINQRKHSILYATLMGTLTAVALTKIDDGIRDNSFNGMAKALNDAAVKTGYGKLIAKAVSAIAADSVRSAAGDRFRRQSVRDVVSSMLGLIGKYTTRRLDDTEKSSSKWNGAKTRPLKIIDDLSRLLPDWARSKARSFDVLVHGRPSEYDIILDEWLKASWPYAETLAIVGDDDLSIEGRDIIANGLADSVAPVFKTLESISDRIKEDEKNHEEAERKAAADKMTERAAAMAKRTKDALELLEAKKAEQSKAAIGDSDGRLLDDRLKLEAIARRSESGSAVAARALETD